MTGKKKIENNLREALFGEKALSLDLYDEALAEYEAEFKESLQKDADDALLCLFVDSGEVAMMLIEPEGSIYRNQDALQRLRALWPQSFDANFQTLIPMFAADISKGMFGVAGIKWLAEDAQ